LFCYVLDFYMIELLIRFASSNYLPSILIFNPYLIIPIIPITINYINVACFSDYVKVLCFSIQLQTY